MCKPANEVQNALYLESVSTRARALMLWVHLNSGQVEYDKREVEILYQSTLDSISEAWCRSHYNVSGYIQAARADLVSTKNVPDHIKEWGNRPLGELEPAGTSTVFFLGEAGYLGEAEAEKVSRSIHGKNEAASVIRYPNGAIEYALGFTDRAREILTAIQSCLSEVDTVVVDGPSTWYALEQLGPELGVSGGKKPVIKTLVDVIAEAGPVLNESILPRPGAMVFYHDGRYPFYLTDSQVDARVITPEFDSQNETWLGSGAVFDGPRELIRQSGLKIYQLVLDAKPESKLRRRRRFVHNLSRICGFTWK